MKPTPTERDNLADELALARVDARVSRADIARRARVSESLVQRVEEKTRTPKPPLLRAYAVLCGLNPDEVLLRWGYTPDDVLTRLQQRPDLCAMVRAA